MAVSLSKGGNVSLTNEAGSAGRLRLTARFGWDTRTTTAAGFDPDASALLCVARDYGVSVG